MNKLYKQYFTELSESHRPDLQPNGVTVRCIGDKDNGYLIVTSDKQTQPNTWLINEKDLTEIK